MCYATVINHCYVTYPHDPVKQAYQKIQEARAKRGYGATGVTLSLTAPPRWHSLAADAVAARHAERGESVYFCIKEFIGFELHHASNLLFPPSDDIRVIDLSELEAIDGVEMFELHGVE